MHYLVRQLSIALAWRIDTWVRAAVDSDIACGTAEILTVLYLPEMHFILGTRTPQTLQSL